MKFTVYSEIAPHEHWKVVRVALHPLDGGRFSDPQSLPFRAVYTYLDDNNDVFFESCRSADFPSRGFGQIVFHTEAEAIAWLIEGETKR